MEENELEEGEALSGRDDDARIDPDVALSYIDEKLQDVLGHFQKDFEGGVSAENLGAKFGGYGSFLPSYQRSPFNLSQPKSPPTLPNLTLSKSPFHSSVENSSVPRGTSVSKNNTASVTQASNSGRKENCISSLSAGGSVSHIDSNNRPVNGSDQKSLKVRIRVGPDNTLARSAAAIYSGLGLDTPLSPEDSPDASLGLSPAFQDAPGESPSSILQVMTCFSLPGGYLLSPLHQNLFQFTESEKHLSRKNCILGKGVKEMSHVPNMTLPMRDMNGYCDKKIKPDEKNGRSNAQENVYCKGDIVKLLKKEMDLDTPASKCIASSTLNMPLHSTSKCADPKAERLIIADLVKDSSKPLGFSKDVSKPLGKDKLLLPDSDKDDQCLSMGKERISGFGNLGSGASHSKGKLNSKTSLLEKVTEERNPSSHNDTSSDTRREGKYKVQKSYNANKLNADEFKSRNDDLVAVHDEPMKQTPAQKVTRHKKDAEKFLQENDQVHEGKRRQKGFHNNSAASVESNQSQGNMRTSSSLVSKPKEKKKSSHARGDYPEHKSKMLKSRKDINRGHSREAHRDVVGKVDAKIVENGANLSEPITFNEKSIERSGVKKDVNLQPEPMEDPLTITPLMTSCPASDAAAALDPPPAEVIKENWVCCDKCQKWRLLPYGSDPDNLPKKWKCSMQVWLPGLNKCHISEEETTKAFNALYLVPASETDANVNDRHDVVASRISSARAQNFDRRSNHDMRGAPTTEKKKSELPAASNVPKSLISRKKLQTSVKNRSLTYVSDFPLETNSSIKACLGLTSKSMDFTTESHDNIQEKHDIPGRYSDGGDFVGKSSKHLKSKSKSEANEDGFQTSKKIKKENLDYVVEDRCSDLDMADKAAPYLESGSSVMVTGKIMQNYSDHSSSMHSECELRGNLSASVKNSKDPLYIDSNRASDMEESGKFDYAAKKRKVKEWQESQVHQDTVVTPQHGLDSRLNSKEAISAGEPRNQKKAKVLKFEGKDLKMNKVDGDLDKKGRPTWVLLSGSREQRSTGKSEEYQETAVSRHAAATSSSSKVSGSRKSKSKLHEVRGSPVESVSSSPLRTSTTEKVSTRRNTSVNDGMVNANPSFIVSPKRCSDGELGSDQSGTQRKETGSSTAAESRVLGSKGRSCHYVEKEANHLSSGSNKDVLYSKRGAGAGLSPTEFEVINAIGDTENILEDNNKSLFEGPEKGHIDNDQDNLNNHQRSNGTIPHKSDRNFSGFKERNRSSNFDANRRKIKVSDSLNNEKELYSAQHGSNFLSEADFNSNVNINYHGASRFENCSFQEKDEDSLMQKNSSTKKSHFDRRDDNSNNEGEETLVAQKEDSNLSVAFAGASCKSNFQEDHQQTPFYPSENPMSHSFLNRCDRSDMVSGRGVSLPVQLSKDKSEEHSTGPQRVSTPIKGSRSGSYRIDAANDDALKVAKQSRKLDNQNGGHPNNLRQATPNGHDSSPIKKDGPYVANAVLKEARDLKHSADRVKNEGQNHESIGIYFEAALKYLHGASLLEPSSADSARHGETNPSMHMMQMYSDTARLCEYCALEYERCQEMAAAALAFKCVEVAYMKVAYHKHFGASKDHQELLTALQTVLPGESPSSSASDIDNLNNHGALDKAAAAKSTALPQIAGNHVIAARNRPNFMRLLTYTSDLNCAFDATKRSQNALAAAVTQEKGGVDGISSVREVLDFNFLNIERLLRLVRLSMGSISC